MDRAAWRATRVKMGRANLDGSNDEILIPLARNLTGIVLGQLP